MNRGFLVDFFGECECIFSVVYIIISDWYLFGVFLVVGCYKWFKLWEGWVNDCLRRLFLLKIFDRDCKVIICENDKVCKVNEICVCSEYCGKICIDLSK